MARYGGLKIKTKIHYLVMALETNHRLDIAGYRREIVLSWADDMIGVMAVFNTEKAAKEYAKNKYKVVKIVVEEEP